MIGEVFTLVSVSLVTEFRPERGQGRFHPKEVQDKDGEERRTTRGKEWPEKPGEEGKGKED